MSVFRVGIIGCGRPHGTDGATGWGMSRMHAEGYKASPDAEIVALADINLENARAFQADYGGERVYEDYRQMLAEAQLDIVSISTWPHLHAPMVIDAARAGVKAIHCEKPMAPTYGEAVRMVQVCGENGVQLTFNHQRRFGAPFRRAKELLKAGAIGELVRLEACCGNLYDWGTHWFDMLFFYNDETPVEWVLGQIELEGGREFFGVPVEGQGLCYFHYRNGVYGLVTAGELSQSNFGNRLVGTEGMIDVGPKGGGHLRMWGRGQSEWQTVQVDEGLHGLEFVKRAILDLIDALKTGREPELSGRRALQATELIFATYESSRRRGRVDLPLQIDDSPLIGMLQARKP